MIVRDENGIIMQHDPNDPLYLDGGDAAARDGMASMSGSRKDRGVMSLFELDDGILSRHPIQSPYDDPRTTTRDQLLQFVAGYLTPLSAWSWNTDRRMPAKRIFWTHAKRGFLCQNTHKIVDDPNTNKKVLVKKKWWDRDILTPSHIGHLIKIAQIYWLYPFLPISYLWLLGDIFWSTYVKPFDESNQIIAMCAVAGDWALRLYCHAHPDWKKPIRDYYSGWRNQPELGELIIKYVKARINNQPIEYIQELQ